MDDLPFNDLLGIGVCLIASAFFSSAETALTALSESRIRQIQEENPRLRRRLQRWLDNPARILASLLVGNNIVNVAASVMGARVAHRYLGSWADAAAVGTMTLLLLSFGEVAPKTFAKRAATFWARRVIGPVCLIDSALRPLSWLFDRLGRATARTAAGAGVPEEQSVIEGDLQHMIAIGQREGVLGVEHGEMLRSLIEFEDTIVKEIMVPRTGIHAVREDESAHNVLTVATAGGHSRLPVYRDSLDNIVGVLHVKDLLRHLGSPESCAVFDWKAHVRSRVTFVPETQKVSAVLRGMQTRREHLAIVVDEFGGTSGMITLEDIVEEIVGEIQDEHDAEEPLVREDADGRLIADARLPLWDLGERLGVRFPDEGDYETLGGFVTQLLGRLPERGARVVWEAFEFVVLDADARRVRQVEIVRPAAASGDAGPEPAGR
ncbi:MAG: hemolysin family protein [Myxococcota bacterium]|nr:hemolysin family protein [Myxococcota bacterium]